MEKPTQILTTIKCQIKVPNLFVYVILISFVSGTGKNYYHLMFLEECKMICSIKTDA